MITTVTLNASIDKAYYMEDTIENGTVMRVAACRNSAGGKGLNVARIAKLCGAKVKATGFVGGFNGQYLEELLEQDGIPSEFCHVKGETRSCINILDERFGSTEYLEPGCGINPEEEEQFFHMFSRIMKDSKVITISGSIPKGVDTDIYKRMIAMTKDMGRQVILDTSGEALRQGMEACPTMVKPNRDELEMLFGGKIRNRPEVISCAKQIYNKGIPYVVVSLGGEGALLVCREGVFQGRPPKVDAVNTVGCGDSMVGAFAVALEREDTPKVALTYAVAVATANALSPATGSFNPEICKEILGQVEVEEIESFERGYRQNVTVQQKILQDIIA
ncbi:1-phosphofructokinase [Blautia schinkii]|nr:1-phosphofructokinase [Blautia schinkii]